MREKNHSKGDLKGTQEDKQRIAVIIPCHNESLTVATVVHDFATELPDALICVCDNCSTDGTAEVAVKSGAVVLFESRLGKGHAIRRLFADIEADAYILVDGDDTYDSKIAPRMVKLLFAGGFDMVVAARKDIYKKAHRTGHSIGNRFFNMVYRGVFGAQFTDIFSGYRVVSRRFVKSFAALSNGFAIETELSVHAQQLRMPTTEIEAEYRKRPIGSHSKLRTYRDAIRILAMMVMLLKDIHPLKFFGLISMIISLGALLISVPIFITYYETGLVPRAPTAVLASAMILLGALSLTCGLILDSVARGRFEAKRHRYLSERGPRGSCE